MGVSRVVCALLASHVVFVAIPEEAAAQVPPHTPGTICFTPQFWCWAITPGIPGQSCYCISATGEQIPGTLG